ncbi:MAG: acylphosphatase [Magnetospirillum sp.]|nr:MAG: acylphosphatase [Magnetospirillum sp.]
MPDTKTVRLLIKGRVQGVWYRGWTVEQATARGLSGWVRNRADGAVEVLVRGSAAVVDDMVNACRRGPPSARVDHIDLSPSADSVSGGFHQRPTV